MRWIEYKKLSNGQTAIIAFNKNWRHEIGNGNDYSVAFAIANKKEDLEYISIFSQEDQDLKKSVIRIGEYALQKL